MLDALIAFLENIEGSAENDQIQGVIGQLKAVKIIWRIYLNF